MDIPEDITILSCNETFLWEDDGQNGRSVRFGYNKIILQDSSGAFHYAKTPQRTMDVKEVILTGLKMHPIPNEHIYPTYSRDLLRASDAIISNCYIKRPALANYQGAEDPTEFKKYMMAEIKICEKLRKSPHPNIAEYLGCLVMEDGLIHGICLPFYEITLLDLVQRDAASVNIRGCLDGIRKGIEHLHGLELVHNDINPSNIMMNSGEAVIIDFDSCAEEGGKRLKGGTMGWEPTNTWESSKQNDYFGLEKIKDWLTENCKVSQTNEQ